MATRSHWVWGSFIYSLQNMDMEVKWIYAHARATEIHRSARFSLKFVFGIASHEMVVLYRKRIKGEGKL